MDPRLIASHDFRVTGDTVIPQKGWGHGLKIYHRFHFSSTLKRMSVIAGHTPPGDTRTHYLATVKGAPETLRGMVSFGVRWSVLVGHPGDQRYSMCFATFPMCNNLNKEIWWLVSSYLWIIIVDRLESDVKGHGYLYWLVSVYCVHGLTTWLLSWLVELFPLLWARQSQDFLECGKCFGSVPCPHQLLTLFLWCVFPIVKTSSLTMLFMVATAL